MCARETLKSVSGRKQRYNFIAVAQTLSAVRRDRHEVDEHAVDKTQILDPEDIAAGTGGNGEEGVAARDHRVLARRKVVAAQHPFLARPEADVDDLRAAFGEQGVQVDRGDRHPSPWWRGRRGAAGAAGLCGRGLVLLAMAAGRRRLRLCMWRGPRRGALDLWRGQGAVCVWCIIMCESLKGPRLCWCALIDLQISRVVGLRLGPRFRSRSAISPEEGIAILRKSPLMGSRCLE